MRQLVVEKSTSPYFVRARKAISEDVLSNFGVKLLFRFFDYLVLYWLNFFSEERSFVTAIDDAIRVAHFVSTEFFIVFVLIKK